ncbi:MAG: heparan-alpha-glucosaminide N-acetyltransferase domain-containing protein [Gemmataceae bacterium]
MNPTADRPSPFASQRLESLDQYRGYTVLAMFVVNFMGGFVAVPDNLKHHHTYNSFADVIMPQFFFAVGFGMRLSWLRRCAAEGTIGAVRHFLGRIAALLLLGFVIYHFTGQYKTWAELTAQPWPEVVLSAIKRQPFETLTHIAVTTLWVLPVIAAPIWGRTVFALGSAGLHVAISLAGYYDWNMQPPAGIDGGPLGFLTWTLPLVAGTLAHDWVMAGTQPMVRSVVVGGVLMAGGIALSFAGNATATWPFVKPDEAVVRNYWLMSQRAGSVTYLLFAAGFAMSLYALFVAIVDHLGWRWSYFDLLGRHALAGYVIHGLVSDAVRPYVPRDAPGWYVGLAILMYLGIVTLFVRYLERNRLFFRL